MGAYFLGCTTQNKKGVAFLQRWDAPRYLPPSLHQTPLPPAPRWLCPAGIWNIWREEHGENISDRNQSEINTNGFMWCGDVHVSNAHTSLHCWGSELQRWSLSAVCWHHLHTDERVAVSLQSTRRHVCQVYTYSYVCICEGETKRNKKGLIGLGVWEYFSNCCTQAFIHCRQIQLTSKLTPTLCV